MAMMGRYELIRALDGGGMAEVFLGRRRGPGGAEKRLVVKRIRRRYARDPRFIRLFVSEAKLSMSLSHRNIVPVFDFGRAGDELFFVMDYIDGVDLSRAIRLTKGPIDPVVAAYIAMEICQALDYAHRVRRERGPAGVVHRDVTPRNVLLSFAGEVKLADFGVATLTDREGPGGVRGTPAYMAPEQATAGDIDARTDLFALGLVLWEMLAGERAYRGTSVDELMAEAEAANVPALSDEVPAALREVVERATARDPEERFTDAHDMQRALDRFVIAVRAEGSLAPPNQLLSHWLRELAPRVAKADAVATPSAPSGSVVTYLEHGESGLADMAGDASALRSMAETQIDDDDDQEQSDEPVAATAPDDETAAVDAARPTWAYLVAVAGVVVIAGAGWFAFSRATLVAAPQPRMVVPNTAVAVAKRPVVDAGVAVPAASVDAAAPPSDAAPVAVDAHPQQRHHPHPPPHRHTPTLPPGRLEISTSPWAKVRVVGTKYHCADTPCVLELPPGAYTIELTNPVARVGKRVHVTVKSKQTHRLNESLTRGP